MAPKNESPVPAATGSGANGRQAEQRDRHTHTAAIAGPQLPHVADEWAKNRRENVRITLDEYQGTPTIDIRTWWFGDDALRPGRSGITLSVRHLPALAEGIAKALRDARELGLLDPTLMKIPTDEFDWAAERVGTTPALFHMTEQRAPG